MLHTFGHHSSTSTYTPNVIEIEETFCGRTDVRIYERIFETGFIRSTLSKSQHNQETRLDAFEVEGLRKILRV